MKGNILLEPFKPGTLGTGTIKGFLFNLGKTIVLNTPSKFRLEPLSNSFIIEVKSDNAGTSNNNQFQFTGAEGNYDVVAKQSGVIVDTFNDLSGQETITFSNGAGTYILEITPKEVSPFNRIQFSRSGDKEKLMDIKQWGNIVWSNMEEAFSGCSNLVADSYTDAPDLSSVLSIRRMFRQSDFNGKISNWDVSNVVNFSEFVLFCGNFNKPVGLWDTSDGVDFGGMLRETSYNQTLVNFVTGSATQLDSMMNSTPFDQDISSWNISNVSNWANFMTGVELSSTNYDLLLNAWSQQSVRPNQSVDFGNSTYTSAGETARNVLINTYGWTISDGGLV